MPSTNSSFLFASHIVAFVASIALYSSGLVETDFEFGPFLTLVSLIVFVLVSAFEMKLFGLWSRKANWGDYFIIAIANTVTFMFWKW